MPDFSSRKNVCNVPIYISLFIRNHNIRLPKHTKLKYDIYLPNDHTNIKIHHFIIIAHKSFHPHPLHKSHKQRFQCRTRLCTLLKPIERNLRFPSIKQRLVKTTSGPITNCLFGICYKEYTDMILSGK